MRLTEFGLERSVVEAMGRVTLQFAALESDIMLSIHLLLADSFKDSDSKIVSDIFTAEMPFRTRVDVFGALCRHKISKISPPSKVDHLFKQMYQTKESQNNSDKSGQHSVLDDILKRLIQAEESRNAIVHSAWRSTKEPGRVSRSKTKTKKFEGLVTLEQTLSLQEIRAIAKSIADAREDLMRFAVIVWYLLMDKAEKKEQSEAT